MALAVHFTTNASLSQYVEIGRQLDAAGLHDPTSRIAHVSWGTDGAVEAFDVWESLGVEISPTVAGAVPRHHQIPAHSSPRSPVALQVVKLGYGLQHVKQEGR